MVYKSVAHLLEPAGKPDIVLIREEKVLTRGKRKRTVECAGDPSMFRFDHPYAAVGKPPDLVQCGVCRSVIADDHFVRDTELGKNALHLLIDVTLSVERCHAYGRARH